jgi:23S rRNA (guanosine2251-2'-O)-methyltransferase
MSDKKNFSRLFLYGIHPCLYALKNPHRKIYRLLTTSQEALAKILKTDNIPSIKIDILEKKRLELLLPKDAVHQGIALEVSPLPDFDISFLKSLTKSNQSILILDQVSDPHNVGAILRSAAVFGVEAVIMTHRHSPEESGVLAKSASGALELIPIIRVNNLAQAIETLKEYGFWTVGFAESGHKTLSEVDLTGKIALIMGAEGDGMRRLTKDLCDFSVCLETASTFTTLNVSNATAIALHETFRQQQNLASPNHTKKK